MRFNVNAGKWLSWNARVAAMAAVRLERAQMGPRIPLNKERCRECAISAENPSPLALRESRGCKGGLWSKGKRTARSCTRRATASNSPRSGARASRKSVCAPSPCENVPSITMTWKCACRFKLLPKRWTNVTAPHSVHRA
jgi:hypothetical protein